MGCGGVRRTGAERGCCGVAACKWRAVGCSGLWLGAVGVVGCGRVRCSGVWLDVEGQGWLRIERVAVIYAIFCFKCAWSRGSTPDPALDLQRPAEPHLRQRVRVAAAHSLVNPPS